MVTDLINSVVNLHKRTALPKPSRTEPTNQVSEFNLVKSGTRKEVRLTDLTDTLKKRPKHAQVRERVQNFKKKIKPLPKPLDKPKADRIRRSIGFDKLKEDLDRYNAVVTSNRSSNHLNFPLSTNVEIEMAKEFSGFRLKSDLQKRLERVDPKPEVEICHLEKKSPYSLTMQEMLARRKEMAKMKVIESYKAAKARRQNKIKSKKYHRIQRREKVKTQIKEFEQLQKTNPEEALKKLDELERGRAEERASLRHRSTGKWAKNKQVKAKYDSTNREELAQQLTLSRELTQKIQVNNDSESEDDALDAPKINEENNPWINNINTSEEVQTFLSGYRKFWDENNERLANIQNLKNESKENPKPPVTQVQNKIKEKRKGTVIRCVATSPWAVSVLSDTDEEDNMQNNEKPKTAIKQLPKQPSIPEAKPSKRKSRTKSKNTNESESNEKPKTAIKQLPKRPSIPEAKPSKRKSRTKSKNTNESEFHKLSFNKEANRPVLDEPLTETNSRTNEAGHLSKALSSILKSDDYNEHKVDAKPKNIDPNNIINTKSVQLQSDLPDLLVNAEDEEEDGDQGDIIAEAFEDDDIVDTFQKEKKYAIDGDKPQDIDLFLPGWGNWGGPGINPAKQRRSKRRFILKFPKDSKRRDENKGNLIINENADDKIKSHLVSEIPFPFKTVKDFEASIRAPIGNTFVPETAYRKIIRPTVKTKMGTVISPMSEDILLKKKN